eukprot:4210711-Amphidinium_carterae.1
MLSSGEDNTCLTPLALSVELSKAAVFATPTDLRASRAWVLRQRLVRPTERVCWWWAELCPH